MVLAEAIYRRRQRRHERRHRDEPAEAPELVMARLSRIEAKLRSMGVRVDSLEDRVYNSHPTGSPEGERYNG